MSRTPDFVVVTGGAGFIGSELVRQLAAAGRRVLVIDNLATGRRENLEPVQDGVELEVADIRDGARTTTLLRGAEVVFHLACLGVRHSIHSPRENHEVNATATLELLRAARRADVARFVAVSSSEVYGTARHAMDEPHPTFLLRSLAGTARDVLRLCADISRARSLLGFSPCIALSDGLANPRDWYLTQRHSPDELLAEESVRSWERADWESGD